MLKTGFMEIGQPEQPRFLTRQEARRLLRISASTLDTEVRSGRLRIHRFGRLVRIDAQDLAAYIADARKVGTHNER